MECDQMSTWIDPYIDGELELPDAQRLESHVASCARCAGSIQDRRSLREAVRRPTSYRPAPGDLRDAITRQLAESPNATNPLAVKTPPWAYAALAACLLLVGVIAFLVPRPTASAEQATLHEAVSSHIRSLMAAHLADIAVSDQHAVKPWFAGKLDFSPRVVDHAAEGFTLTGGRLDYISGRPVAAIVYARRAHIINLFTCPDPAAKPSPPLTIQDRGYNAITWSDGAMRFCAVSDVNKDELQTFVALVDATPAAPPLR